MQKDKDPNEDGEAGDQNEKLLTINDTYSKHMNELYYNPKLTQKKQDEYQYHLERSPRGKKLQGKNIDQNNEIDKFLSVLMATPKG